MRKILLATAAVSVVMAATPAWAHVTIQPNEAIAGGFQTFYVQVPNERDDSSTTKVEVQFPPAFASVSFQDVEGWEREVKMVQFDEPIESFGEEVTEGVGSVVFSGGEVEPGEFVRFPFSVGPLPGGDLEFKAIQTYDSGEVVRWVGPLDGEEPAPHVNGIELEVEEGQGQLGVLADLHGQVASAEGVDVTAETDAASDGGAMIIAIAAGVLAVLALIVALIKKKA